MRREGRVVLGAAALLLAGSAQAQAANLFDDLARAIFGQPRVMRAAPIEDYQDPAPRIVRPRPAEISSKPKPPVVKLDPASDSDWYLKDPTLRRGDIVVTSRGVMVFQGRDADVSARQDFVALGGKAGEKSWKGQLQTAAAGGRSFFRDGGGAPPATATATLSQPASGEVETATR